MDQYYFAILTYILSTISGISFQHNKVKIG